MTIQRHGKDIPNGGDDLRSIERVLTRLLGSRHVDKMQELPDEPLSHSLEANTSDLQKIFADCDDFKHRKIRIGKQKRPATIVYLKETVDSFAVQEGLIEPLQKPVPLPDKMERVLQETLQSLPAETIKSVGEAVQAILAGKTVFMIDGMDVAASLELKQFEERAVDLPQIERTIIGPRDAFVEALRTNMSLIRRRLHNHNLKIRQLKIGKETATDICVCYMADKVRPGLLSEVLHRLDNVDLPKILDISYLDEAISDHPLSPFAQSIYTERPDRVVANVLEGRVAILADGSPAALVVPAGFVDLFQSPEDYYLHPIFAAFFRGMRVIATIVTLCATAAYVAGVVYHYELIPSRVLVELAQNRARVPFQATLEALLMELSIELIREASTRLPTAFGQTIGIVGALVIGDAAIRANLVSPLLVIVVALATIGSFAIPNYNQAIGIRLMRFPIILATGVLGGFGLVFSVTALIVHLASMDSFGTPYLRPIAPLRKTALRDLLTRPFKQI